MLYMFASAYSSAVLLASLQCEWNVGVQLGYPPEHHLNHPTGSMVYLRALCRALFRVPFPIISFRAEVSIIEGSIGVFCVHGRDCSSRLRVEKTWS